VRGSEAARLAVEAARGSRCIARSASTRIPKPWRTASKLYENPRALPSAPIRRLWYHVPDDLAAARRALLALDETELGSLGSARHADSLVPATVEPSGVGQLRRNHAQRSRREERRRADAARRSTSATRPVGVAYDRRARRRPSCAPTASFARSS
jgi:hypothetical protein